MAQIQSDIVFNNFPGTNSQVTADLLNNHVNQARLLSGAISDQTPSVPVSTDSILIQRTTQLHRSTIQQLIDLAASALSSTFLRLSGGTMTGALTLNANPSVALGAATKQYVDSTISASGVPSGCIAMWASGFPVPAGWIELDGRSALPYPALNVFFGTNIPDFRGVFVRGWVHGRAGSDPDPSRALLSVQGQSIQSHTHSYQEPYFTTVLGAGNPGGNTLVQSGTTGATGGTETRPTNTAVMYIIKT